MIEEGAVKGITMQPATLDGIEGYRALMVAQGFPARMVVFTGLSLGQDHLIQLLDFPLDRGAEVMRLCKSTFGIEMCGFQLLRAIEWHELPEAWQYSCCTIASAAASILNPSSVRS